MNRKYTLGIILILTILTLGIILLLTTKERLEKHVIKDSKWNKIINNKKESNSIKLNEISFNDYNLLIDENNSIIYYSVVNSSKKYNPIINYTSDNKIKLALNEKITDNKKEYKIMIYNNIYYHIYTLKITNNPIINFEYNKIDNNKNIIPTNIELFDNNIDSPQKILKSKGNLIIGDNDIKFSLIKESPGKNKRDNNISIFGMEKHNEYILKKINNEEKNKNYLEVFINNEYIGKYSLERRK